MQKVHFLLPLFHHNYQSAEHTSTTCLHSENVQYSCSPRYRLLLISTDRCFFKWPFTLKITNADVKYVIPLKSSVWPVHMAPSRVWERALPHLSPLALRLYFHSARNKEIWLDLKGEGTIGGGDLIKLQVNVNTRHKSFVIWPLGWFSGVEK